MTLQKELCKLPKTYKTTYGIELLSFKRSFLWNTLGDNVKQVPIITQFKNKMKMGM